MSTIDRRIVEMKFDNADFSKNTKDTLKDLEKLENALKLEGAGKGLEGIEKSAKGFSLNPITDAISGIGKGFGVMSTLGVGALFSISNAAVKAGTSLVKNIMEPLFGGGKRRALNIENADFTLKGLGSSIAEMQEAIDWAVLDTSYGMDAAAKASSMIYASGYKSIDEQKIILRGISGIAAMTNSSYEDISDVMTKVAGQGRLMGDDMNRLASRGLNVAATMAEAFDMTEEELRDLVSEGGVSFMDFATVMDAAYGEHAKKANDTFTGAVSNFKAAWSRIGAQFFTPYHESVRNLANGFKPLVDIIGSGIEPVMTRLGQKMITMSEGVNGYLENFLYEQDYYDTMWNTVHNIALGFEHLGIAIRDGVMPFLKGLFGYFWQGDIPLFHGIEKITDAFVRFTLAIKPSAKSMRNMQKIGRALGAILSLLWDILSGVIGALWGVTKGALDADTGFLDLLGTVADAITSFVDMVKESGALQYAFEKIGSVGEWLGGVIGAILEVGRKTWDLLRDVGVVDAVSDAFQKMGEWIRIAFDWITEKTEPARSAIQDFFSDTENLKALWESFVEFLRPAGEFFVEVFDKLKTSAENAFESMKENMSGLPEMFDRIKETLKNAFEGGTINFSISDIFGGVGGFFGSIWDGLNEALSSAKDAASGPVEGIVGIFKGIWDSISAAVGDTTSYDVHKLINKGILAVLVGALYKFVTQIADISQAMSGMFDSIGKAFGELGGYFKTLSQSMKYNNLLKIAAAIAIVALSIWLLSKIPTEDLWPAVAAIGAITIAMMILSKSLSAMGNSLGKVSTGKIIASIAGIALILLAIGLVIKISSDALMPLTSVPIPNLIAATIALGVLLAEVAAIAILLGKNNQNFVGGLAGAGSMLLIAASLWVISQALLPLTEVPGEALLSAVAALSAVLWQVFLVVGLLGLISGAYPPAMVGMLAAGGAILLVMVGLVLVAQAIGDIAAIPIDNAEAALDILMSALEKVALVVGILGLIPTAALGGAALWLAGGGLLDIAQALVDVADINPARARDAIAVLGEALEMVNESLLGLGGSFVLDDLIMAAVAWLSGGALKKLADGLISIEGVKVSPTLDKDLKRVSDGINTFGGVGGIFDGLAGMLSGNALVKLADGIRAWDGITVSPTIDQDLNRIATGIDAFGGIVYEGIFDALAGLLAGGALISLAEGIRAWEGITTPPTIDQDLIRISTGINSFSGVASIMDAMAGMLSGGALYLLANGIRAWSTVTVPETIDEDLKRISSGIEAFGGIGGILDGFAASKGADALTDIANAVRSWRGVKVPPTIEQDLIGLANGVKSFDAGLFNNHGDAKRAATILADMKTAVKGFPTNLGNVGKGLTDISAGMKDLNGAPPLTGFVSSLDTSIQTISKNLNTSGVNLMKSLLDGFRKDQGKVSDVGKTIGAKLIAAINTQKASINDAGKNAVAGISTAMRVSMNNQSGSIYSAAKYLGQRLGDGLVAGINSRIGSVSYAASNVARTAKTAIGGKLGWDIRSPSRLGIYLGDMLGAGLEGGILGRENRVAMAASLTAEAALESLNEAFMSPDTYGLDNLGPIITPVLDLSQVEHDANGIAGLFNGVNASIESNASRVASLSANQNRVAEEGNPSMVTYHYEQTLNSPKALDNAEIYRQSKSLVERAKKGS